MSLSHVVASWMVRPITRIRWTFLFGCGCHCCCWQSWLSVRSRGRCLAAIAPNACYVFAPRREHDTNKTGNQGF